MLASSLSAQQYRHGVAFEIARHDIRFAIGVHVGNRKLPRTLPLANGEWEFSAPLASGTTTCVRDIQPESDLAISFVDGVMGCGGPESAMPVDPMAPVDPAMPTEGTEPVEPTTG